MTNRSVHSSLRVARKAILYPIQRTPHPRQANALSYPRERILQSRLPRKIMRPTTPTSAFPVHVCTDLSRPCPRDALPPRQFGLDPNCGVSHLKHSSSQSSNFLPSQRLLRRVEGFLAPCPIAKHTVRLYPIPSYKLGIRKIPASMVHATL